MTTEFDSVKDSGVRRDFETGSRRDVRTGKGRYDLLNPIVTLRLAKHYENGAVKYGDHNWELGQNMMNYLDSCKRHLDKFQEGHRDEDHLAAAMWNIASMIYTEEMVKRGILPEALNDMPNYLTKDGFERTIGKTTREFNNQQREQVCMITKKQDEFIKMIKDKMAEEKKEIKWNRIPVTDTKRECENINRQDR